MAGKRVMDRADARGAKNGGRNRVLFTAREELLSAAGAMTA